MTVQLYFTTNNTSILGLTTNFHSSSAKTNLMHGYDMKVTRKHPVSGICMQLLSKQKMKLRVQACFTMENTAI